MFHLYSLNCDILYSRWVKNERSCYGGFFLPRIQHLFEMNTCGGWWSEWPSESEMECWYLNSREPTAGLAAEDDRTWMLSPTLLECPHVWDSVHQTCGQSVLGRRWVELVFDHDMYYWNTFDDSAYVEVNSLALINQRMNQNHRWRTLRAGPPDVAACRFHPFCYTKCWWSYCYKHKLSNPFWPMGSTWMPMVLKSRTWFEH